MCEYVYVTDIVCIHVKYLFICSRCGSSSCDIEGIVGGVLGGQLRHDILFLHYIYKGRYMYV